MALLNNLYALDTWYKVLSSAAYVYGYQIEDLPDGTFAIVGANGSNLHLMKIDINGNVLKEKDVRVLGWWNAAHGLIKSPDGNLLMVGTAASSDTSPRYAFLIKLDTSFNVLWWDAERKAGSWSCSPPYYAADFFDVTVVGNRVIAVGDDEHCAGNEAEGKISIFDLSTGSPLFRGAYIMSGGSFPNSPISSVIPINNNLIYAFGGNDYPDNVRIKVWAFDTLGNILWGKALYTSFNIRPAITSVGGKGIVRLPDGRILLLIECNAGTSNVDAGFAILDTALNVIRANCIQGTNNELLGAIIEDFTPGYYIVVGRTASYGSGGYDAFMMKIDTLGNIIWFKTYGGADYDEFLDVVKTPDTGYIVVGRTKSFTGNWEMIIAKMDTSGRTCGLYPPPTYTPSTYPVSLSITSGYTPISFTYTTLSTLDTATSTLTVSQICSSIGISEADYLSNISILSDGIFIRGKGNYSIYTVSGRLFRNGKVEKEAFVRLPRGIYFLKFNDRLHKVYIHR